MYRPLVLSSLLFLSGISNAQTFCGVLGPAFPAPSKLAASDSFKTAASKFSDQLKKDLSEGTIDNKTTSFSVNIFSTTDDDLLWEHHYEAPDLKGSIAEGKTLNGDTIYRLASISKLWTVYLFLIEAGFDPLNDPVTKYVPEIAEAFKAAGDDADDTTTTQWDDITLGALASQMSGIGRGPISDLANWIDQDAAAALGLPPLEQSDIPPCGITAANGVECTRKQFLDVLLDKHPVFSPFKQPSYSTYAYGVLAMALETIKEGTTYDEMLERSIYKPLNLERTGTKKPDDADGIIPAVSHWNVSLGPQNPGGGIYSSANDLAKFGQSILRSSLLSPVQTQRWMKPHAHTTSLTASVGSPWEIFRLTKPRVIDAYAKEGDLTGYSSNIILFPAYNIGVSILTAGTGASAQKSALSDLLSTYFTGVAEDEAKLQATAKYVGTYSSKADGGNSTVTIGAADDGGLLIESWILNGKEGLAIGTAGLGGKLPEGTTFRLYPTGLESEIKKSKRDSGKATLRKSFRMQLTLKGQEVTSETVFTNSCRNWYGHDNTAYGNLSWDEFVFEIDGEGNVAVGLEPVIGKGELLKRVEEQK